MGEDIYAARAKEKKLHEAYRLAAREAIIVLPKATVAIHANVHQMEMGAFVEISLWVPREDAEKLV